MEVLIPLMIAAGFWFLLAVTVGQWFGKQVGRPEAGVALSLIFGPFGWLLTLLLPRR